MHTYKTRIPFRDIDMHGHMHNSAFMVHAETAVNDYWRQQNINGNLEESSQEPLYFVKKVELSFSQPVRFEDELELSVHIEKIGNTSISFAVHITKKQKACADIKIIWVAVDRKTLEPVKIPEKIRALIED